MNAQRLPWGPLAPVLALLMVVATALAGSFLIEPFVRLDAKGNPVDPAGLMAYTLVPFGLLALLLFGWVRIAENRRLRDIGFAGPRKVRTFLRGYATGLASMIVLVGVIGLAGGYAVAGAGTAWDSPGALLTVVLLVPCLALQSSAEELLFRGWLLDVLRRKHHVAAAVIVSSALFGLLHFTRGQHGLATASNFLFGVFCCCWVLRSGNVLGAMGWHSGWNWILATGFGLPLSGLDAGIPSLVASLQPVGAHWLHGGAQGPEASVACVAYFLVGSGMLLAWRRR
jgi:membrane protease YdiL (CAAX protease family)